MENILYALPDDYMVTVDEESVLRIKQTAIGKRLTTNRLAIKTGLGREVIENLYYRKHRIRLSHLRILCDVVFNDNKSYVLQENCD